MKRGQFLRAMTALVVTHLAVLKIAERLKPWTLADAIGAARPGDVIYVPPGRYHTSAPLLVRDGVTLQMEDSHVIASHDDIYLIFEGRPGAGTRVNRCHFMRS